MKKAFDGFGRILYMMRVDLSYSRAFRLAVSICAYLFGSVVKIFSRSFAYGIFMLCHRYPDSSFFQNFLSNEIEAMLYQRERPIDIFPYLILSTMIKNLTPENW